MDGRYKNSFCKLCADEGKSCDFVSLEVASAEIRKILNLFDFVSKVREKRGIIIKIFFVFRTLTFLPFVPLVFQQSSISTISFNTVEKLRTF